MNKDLPDFIVLRAAFWSAPNANIQALYSGLWGCGFLPSEHQGVAFLQIREVTNLGASAKSAVPTR